MTRNPTARRVQVAIDTYERTLGRVDARHRASLAALREEVDRILALDEDERPTLPGVVEPPRPRSESGVRGLWEGEGEKLTPVVHPHGRRLAR